MNDSQLNAFSLTAAPMTPPNAIAANLLAGLKTTLNITGELNIQASGLYTGYKRVWMYDANDVNKFYWTMPIVGNISSLQASTSITDKDTIKTELRKKLESSEGIKFEIYPFDFRWRLYRGKTEKDDIDSNVVILNPIIAAYEFGARIFSDTIKKENITSTTSRLTFGVGIQLPLLEGRHPSIYFLYRYHWIMTKDKYERIYQTSLKDEDTHFGLWNVQGVIPIGKGFGLSVDGKIGNFTPEWSVGIVVYK